jgi:hypothetical protein
MPDYVPKEVDAWVIRCIFNRSHIVARIANGEFKLVVAKSKLSKSTRYPENTKNEHIRIYDHTDTEVATAHRFLFSTGTTSPLDPKTVKIGNVRYTVYPDKLLANPEEKMFKSKWMRKAYGWNRKIRCRVCGPIDNLPRTPGVS